MYCMTLYYSTICVYMHSNDDNNNNNNNHVTIIYHSIVTVSMHTGKSFKHHGVRGVYIYIYIYI